MTKADAFVYGMSLGSIITAIGLAIAEWRIERKREKRK